MVVVVISRSICFIIVFSDNDHVHGVKIMIMMLMLWRWFQKYYLMIFCEDDFKKNIWWYFRDYDHVDGVKMMMMRWCLYDGDHDRDNGVWWRSIRW